jgi:hypothetical protein
LDLVKSPKYMERFHVVSLLKGIGEHFSKWKHLLLSMVPRTPCIINFATTGDGVLEGWSRWWELQDGGDGSDVVWSICDIGEMARCLEMDSMGFENGLFAL